MKKLLRLVVLLLLVPLFGSCAYEFVVCLDRARNNSLPIWFFAGIGSFVLLYAFVLRSRIRFLENFAHELAHMVMNYLTLDSVIEFVSRRDPDPDNENKIGWVTSRHSNFLDVLAPYYLPTAAVPFLIGRLYTGFTAARIMDFLLGAMLTFHLVLYIKQFRPHQTDVRKMGFIFSFLFVTMMNVLILLLVMNIVWGNGLGIIRHHLFEGFYRAFDLYKMILGRFGIVL